MGTTHIKEDPRNTSLLNALIGDLISIIDSRDIFIRYFDVVQKNVRACCSFDVCVLTANTVPNTRKNPRYKCHGEMKGTSCSFDIICVLTAHTVTNTCKNPWYECHGEMKGTQYLMPERNI